MLLRNYIKRAARSYPEKIAIIDGDIQRSWAEVDNRTERLGAALQHLGVTKGERTCILSHDHLEVLEHWLACSKIGAVRVGINWRYSPVEINHIILDSGAKLIFVQENCIDIIRDLIPSLEESGCVFVGFGGKHDFKLDYETLIENANSDCQEVSIDPIDLIAISYTTGSTGFPKGALWRHSAVVESAIHFIMNVGFRHEDIFLMPSPMPGAPILFNTLGVINGMTTVLIGGDFEPKKFWELIQQHKVTVANGVPTMVQRSLDAFEVGKFDANSLRLMFYGSAPMTPTQIKRVYDVLGCELFQAYGSTETHAWAACLRPEDHRRGMTKDPHFLKSCGRPGQHIDMAVFRETGEEAELGEVGEICIRGEVAILSYHENATDTENLYFGEWMRTGDIGRVDEQGYFYIVDRKKFMIISGGYNVYPVVVENVLSEHDAVREVAVFGCEHPVWGEAVTATVSLRSGASVTESELIEYVRPKLAKWEVPKYIEIMDDLPKGVTGKIDRNILRQGYRENPENLPWNL